MPSILILPSPGCNVNRCPLVVNIGERFSSLLENVKACQNPSGLDRRFWDEYAPKHSVKIGIELKWINVKIGLIR